MAIDLTEEKERELVEKVELRLALADTPQKFEHSLDTFLAPLLLKLASPHASVRQTVFNSLKDILSRLNSLKEVKVPVRKLLFQAQNPPLNAGQDGSNVRLYSLLLVSKGVDRLKPDEKNQLIPLMMKGISSLPLATAARTFHIICKLLLNWEPPLKGSKDEDIVRNYVNLEKEEDLNFLLEKFTQFFHLVPARADSQSGAIPRGYTCPGLCSTDVSFFTYDAGVTFTKEQMIRFKSAIFKFVTNGFVPDDQLLIKFLSVVSKDSSDVSTSAAQHLKRLNVPYEDPDFIGYLISLYTGNKNTGTPPVKPELQEKILTLLNKSTLSTTNPKSVSLICSIGIHSRHHKLRSLSLIFVRHVAKHNYQNLIVEMEGEGSADFPTSVASLIRNTLHAEGWPRLYVGSSTANYGTSTVQRRLQYETLGDILRRDFRLLEDLSYIEFLFDSLKGDLSEFRASIQEALASLTINLSQLPPSSKLKLRKIIRQNVADDYEVETAEDEERREATMACRFIAIKFANAAFPFDDAEARMFNVWGTSRTNRFDIIEESYKGLHPYWFRVMQASNTIEFKPTRVLLASEITQTQFPSFSDFVLTLLREKENALTTSTSAVCRTLNVAVRFAKQCLVSEAVYGKPSIVTQDEDWSVRVEKAIAIDEVVSKEVFNIVFNIEEKWLVEFLTFLCKEFISKDENGKQISFSKYEDTIYGQVLLTLLPFCNDTTLAMLNNMIPSLYSYLGTIETTNDSNLETAANILGIIAASLPLSDNLRAIVNSLENCGSETKIESSIFANSYIFPRLYLRGNLLLIDSGKLQILLNKLVSLMSVSKFKPIANKLISQVSKYGLLLLLDSETRQKIFSSIMANLQTELLNDAVAVETWGYLSLYSDEFGQFELFFKKLFETHVSKQVDYLFSAGEALSILAGGWYSKFLSQQLDVLGISREDLQKKFGDRNLSYVIDQVFMACDSTKPNLRRASCLWLLSIVQYLGKDNHLSSRCSEIHLRFMRFLADRDEFIQESAARGLSLVYEMGDTDLKEGMVKGLLRSFTDTSSTTNMSSGSVSADTELFEADTLKTNDGSIRTYKDILNLASEVGDPALVYKFMSLAKSSSLWSSKKGIAFGLGAIMSKSSLQNLLLEDRNSAIKLIPKLFRYKFDPYTNVARSMNDIWNTLITDSSSTVSKYFDDILRELLAGMASKEWRVREASAMALLQLVQSQPQEKFADQMLDIWTMAFRAMDDIKESVREAGTKLTRALSKILARTIDVSKGVKPEKSKRVLENILPFLLGIKGLNSDAEEVRNFALKTLIDLVKNSGNSLKPFSVQLVYEFTLLFSSIEPQVINYLSLNANNYKIDADAIDIHRRNGVASSPLLEAIERLIINSDDSMLEDHVNSAIKATKKSLGLPSKVAASIVFNLLVQKYSILLKPFSGKLLKSCTNSFVDRNDSINLAFAHAFGHIYHVAPLDKTVKYAEQLSAMYFSSSEVSSKKVVAAAVEAVLKYAPSQFEDVSTIFMPLLFIASNDVDKPISALFGKIWTEASMSGSGTVKLYIEEIMNLLGKQLSSNDFSTRKTCGKAISLLCEKVDLTIKDKQIQTLFGITTEALTGRSWEGKEVILKGLECLVVKFRCYVSVHDTLKTKLCNVFTNELSRKNQDYVKKIVFSYCEFVQLFPDRQMIDKLLQVVQSVLETEKLGGNSADYEISNKRIKPNSEISKKSSKKNIEKEEYTVKLLRSCAGICAPIDTKEYPDDLLNFILRRVSDILDNEDILYTWRSQIAACEIGIEIIDSYDMKMINENFENSMMLYWEKLYQCNSTKESTENVKIQMIKLGGKLSSKVPGLRFKIEGDLRNLSDAEATSRIENELRNVGISP